MDNVLIVKKQIQWCVFCVISYNITLYRTHIYIYYYDVLNWLLVIGFTCKAQSYSGICIRYVFHIRIHLFKIYIQACVLNTIFCTFYSCHAEYCFWIIKKIKENSHFPDHGLHKLETGWKTKNKCVDGRISRHRHTYNSCV